MPIHGFTPLLLWLLPMWRILTPVTSHPSVSRCQLMQKTAICNLVHLSNVPLDLPLDTEELQLNHNHIKTLTESSLTNYPSLNTLSLACNSLERLEPNAFQDSQLLASLNLANNNLFTGYPDSSMALKTLPDLKALDLSENKLDEEMVALLLQNLTSVEYLNLSGNLMQRLDNTILSNLYQLKELDLQRNILFEIDSAFKNNLNLQRLNLAFNYLSCLTDFHMTHLVVLNASHNFIDWFISRQDLDDTFLLETLDLSHNRLLFFPFLPSHSHLRNLYLSYNQLSFYTHLDNFSFPNLTTTVEFYNLKNYTANVTAELWKEEGLQGDISSLVILDLQGNRISYFPQGFIQKMPYLSRLLMCTNCLESLNLTSERFPGSLYELDVSKNSLNQIVADECALATLGNLTYLNLSQNYLKWLPSKMFSSLSNLRSVDLSYNNIDICLTDKPTDDFFNCVDWKNVISLKRLYLKGCNIKKIPNSAFHEMSLTHLELSENPEVNVQQSIEVLWQTLQHLGLGNTQIQNFEFSQFKFLKFLNISSNSLTKIPNSILQIDLKNLDLRDNQLSTIPSNQADVLAPKLNTVYLTGNPFNCCQTEWFRTFEATKTMQVAGKSDIKCADLFHRIHIVEDLEPSLCLEEEGESVFWYIMLFMPVCVSFIGILIIVLLSVKPKVLQRSIKKKCLKPTSY